MKTYRIQVKLEVLPVDSRGVATGMRLHVQEPQTILFGDDKRVLLEFWDGEQLIVTETAYADDGDCIAINKVIEFNLSTL